MFKYFLYGLILFLSTLLKSRDSCIIISIILLFVILFTEDFEDFDYNKFNKRKDSFNNKNSNKNNNENYIENINENNIENINRNYYSQKKNKITKDDYMLNDTLSRSKSRLNKKYDYSVNEYDIMNKWTKEYYTFDPNMKYNWNY